MSGEAQTKREKIYMKIKETRKQQLRKSGRLKIKQKKSYRKEKILPSKEEVQ